MLKDFATTVRDDVFAPTPSPRSVRGLCGERRGFTVKPTAKYVDECLDVVQLQNAKAVMTPFDGTEGLASTR